MSRYGEWSRIKEELNERIHRAPHVSEGDIWWISIGLNIGSEVYGKNAKFVRPVVIYKKLSRDFYLAIPTSSKQKVGSWFVSCEHKGRLLTACLYQARSIDYRRLLNKAGTLDESDFKKVKKGFRDLFT